MPHPYNIGLCLAFWKSHLSRSVHQEKSAHMVAQQHPNTLELRLWAASAPYCSLIHINNARHHLQKIVAGIRSGITSAIDHQLISTSSASEATGIHIPVPCTYRFNCTSVKFYVEVHLFGRGSATEGTGLGRYKHDVCKKGSWVLPQLLATSLQGSLQHPNRPHIPTIGARLDFAD